MKLLTDIHERNASLSPDAPAVVFEGRVQPYNDYWVRINMIAAGLYGLGARRQDRIALLSMNRLEYLEVYGACERAGFIMATVNFRLASPEIAFVLSDSAPHTLIFEEQYTDLVDGLRASLCINRFVCIGNSPPWAISYDALAESGAPEGPPCRPVPDDAALIIYTSGTTGRPKGVVRSQRAEVRYAELMSGLLATRGNTRQLLMMPFFHIGARCQYIASFWRAGAVHVHRKFDPTEILKTIQQHRITHLHVAPTMLQSILDVPDIENYDVSSVETLLYSAAPMPTPLLQRGIAIFGNVFANGYGGTEANATYLAPHQHHPNGKSKQVARLASVGQAIVDVELRIVDDAGNVCPTGIRGEVAVRTDTMLDQYWNNGPATVEALRDGFFHTGDIGYLDDEGYLFLVDRKKDMIISGGENVYCREVEEAIEKHPAVFEVAIIGVPDAKWGETVRAIVVLNAGMKLTATDLIEYVRGRIAHYKCPKSVVFVDALPRLQSGKVSKVTLRERFSGDLK